MARLVIRRQKEMVFPGLCSPKSPQGRRCFWDPEGARTALEEMSRIPVTGKHTNSYQGTPALLGHEALGSRAGGISSEEGSRGAGMGGRNWLTTARRKARGLGEPHELWIW